MALYTIDIQEAFDLPRDRVFALFADHRRFGKLIGAPIRRIRDSDQADPNGNGSVRRVGLGPLSIEETITVFEPDSLIEYTLTSAVPLRNHLGRIRFNDEPGGGTRVRYTIHFEERIPMTGRVLYFALDRALRRGIRRVPRLA